MNIPQIQIRQQYAKIGIETTQGMQSIRQPKAEMEITTSAAKLDIESPQGVLRIDQSRAWDALGVGSYATVSRRVAAEASRIAMEGIARIVQDGDHLAAIHNGSDAIADLAEQALSRTAGINYVGEPSFKNVDVEYVARKPAIDVQLGGADIRAQARNPEFQYVRGNVDIYMRQYARVDIYPPMLDIRM